MSLNIDYVKFNSKKNTVEVYYNGEIVHEIPTSLVKYVENICRKHGSTCRGRIDSFKFATDSRQKPSILVSSEYQVLLMPTKSLENEDCFLINYYNTVKCTGKGRNITSVEFLNKSILVIELDSRVLKNQMYRCGNYINYLEY